MQRVELREDRVLGLLVDDERLVAALAARRPVSTTRSRLVGCSANTSRMPSTALRQAPSQSGSSAFEGRWHRRHTRRVPELTPAQARAVAHAGGPLLVLGGAGSGKTTVLAQRFAWLVAHEGAAPESILVLTPSAAGAAALRRAVEDALDGPYEELAIHSVRDFCARLLREETAEAGVDPFFAPVSRADRLALLLDRMDDLHLRSHDIGGRPAVLLADVIDRIDRLKDALVTATDYAAWADVAARRATTPSARAPRARPSSRSSTSTTTGCCAARGRARRRRARAARRRRCCASARTCARGWPSATATCSSTSTPISASRRRCSSSCSAPTTSS